MISLCKQVPRVRGKKNYGRIFRRLQCCMSPDRSPIESDTAQSLITFSQESVIREAYSPSKKCTKFNTI